MRKEKGQTREQTRKAEQTMRGGKETGKCIFRDVDVKPGKVRGSVLLTMSLL